MGVVDLEQFRKRNEPAPEPERTVTGPCRCLHCQHQWNAVMPAGTLIVECPACGVHKGITSYLVLLEGFSWHCKCGNDLFQLTPRGAMCITCGGQHYYDDITGAASDWPDEDDQ